MAEIYDWEEQGSFVYDWEGERDSERFGLLAMSGMYRVAGAAVSLVAIGIAAKADINLLHAANDVKQSGQADDAFNLAVAASLAWGGSRLRGASRAYREQADNLV